MTRTSKLLALLIGLVVIIGLAFGATKLIASGEEKTAAAEAQAIADATLSVFTCDSSEITAARWQHDGDTFAFTKQSDGSWTCDTDDLFPVSKSSLEDILAGAENVTSLKMIEAPADINQFGFSAPAVTIDLTFPSGVSQILIGNETGVGGQRYCYNGDGNVYIIETSLYETFMASFSNVLELEAIPKLTDIVSFTAARADGSSLTVCRDEGTWTGEQEGKAYSFDKDLAHTYYKNLRDIAWASVMTWSADEAYLEETGLSAPQCTVDAIYRDNDGNEQSVTFLIGDYFAGEDGNEYYYCAYPGSRMAYIISASTAEAFITTNASDLVK